MPTELERAFEQGIHFNAQLFGADAENLLSQKYFVLTPNPEAGYKQLYTFEA